SHDGLRLCDGWPTSWTGQALDVRGVCTPWGRVGFALRWHDTRPAILWEIEPAQGQADELPVVTAPRIDPTWSGRGWEGEALLQPTTEPPTAPASDLNGATGPMEGESFS
ncbi:MAG: hypothetical protein ACKOYM_00375, partial [Actinomycetes bacterium]